LRRTATLRYWSLVQCRSDDCCAPAIFDATFERLGHPPRRSAFSSAATVSPPTSRVAAATAWPPTGSTQPAPRRPADATPTYEIHHLNELTRLLL